MPTSEHELCGATFLQRFQPRTSPCPNVGSDPGTAGTVPATEKLREEKLRECPLVFDHAVIMRFGMCWCQHMSFLLGFRMRNATFAIWTGTYIILAAAGYQARGGMAWLFLLLLLFQMPVLLFGYLRGKAIASKFRSALVFLQFPFAVALWFRNVMPEELFIGIIIVYLVASIWIARKIRSCSPSDFVGH